MQIARGGEPTSGVRAPFGPMGGRARRGQPIRAVALAATLLAAAPLAAQEIEPLTPEAFLDLVEGRTIVVADPATGAELARETFLGRDATDYRLAEGTCLAGVVTTRGSQLCFDYGRGDGPHCWWIVRLDGRLMARSAPMLAGLTLEITAVVDEPVACAAPPVS